MTYKSLYSFKGGKDGENPLAALTHVGSTLYSTTAKGGAGTDGTVFSITTSGTEKVSYSFKGFPKDGAQPQAGLTDVNGTLYGATLSGGANGEGAIFTITTAGDESLLYSFKGGKDGQQPDAALTDVKGTLYGTTFYGGATSNEPSFRSRPPGRRPCSTASTERTARTPSPA